MAEEGVFVETTEIPPEPHKQTAVTWLRENLFYSWGSGITTVVLSYVLFNAVKALLAWIIDPLRKWAAVTANARLLMVHAYPGDTEIVGDNFWRVWVSIGIVFVLAGLSAAVWGDRGKLSVAQTSKGLMFGSAIVGAVAWLTPTEGSWRVSLVLAAVVVGGAALAWRKSIKGSIHDPLVPIMLVVGLLLLAALTFVNWVRLPVQEVLEGGEKLIEYLPLADSTSGPWSALIATLPIAYAFGWAIRYGKSILMRGLVGGAAVAAGVVLAILMREDGGLPLTLIVAAVLLVGALFLSADRLRQILTASWILSFPVILMVVMRAPDIEWGKVLSVDLPIFAIVGLFVSGVLYLFGNPKTGEWKYIAAAAWLILAVIWVFRSFWLFDPESLVELGFLGSYDLPFKLSSQVDFLQVLEFKFPLIMGAIFALAAPSFGGPRAARLRYIGIWWVALLLLIISFRLGESASILELRGQPFVGGMALTFTLAISGLALSFPLGVLLALGRASTMPIIRTISTVYIELVRSVPLITWLYVGANLLNLFLQGVIDIANVVRAIIAITLFSAAYLAENVRGGLQSIPKGQYEAADAVGMSVVQKTVLITLPQALKAVIPALVGQVIALFKDTSLVAIIGLFDLLFVARSLIPSQSANLGSILEATVAVAVVYWIFTFSISRSSLRLERRLGLGTR